MSEAASPWEAVVQRMLLGSARSQAAVTGIGPLGEMLARLNAKEAERSLLASAALVSAFERAGRLAPRPSAPARAAAALESSDAPVTPPVVASLLAKMLSDINPEVLPELLDGVARRGWRVPTNLLPVLLYVGHNAPHLRAKIAGAVGARGRWLAGHNPDWSFAAEPVAADAEAIRKQWETGTAEERTAVLARARKLEPTLGRTLVESTWSEDAPPDRAAFLERLGVGLSLADEPFLQTALGDKRQEVRRAAGELLRRIPDSALVKRVTARAHAALAWKAGKKKGEIVVTLPEKYDDALAADGVEKKPPHGTGERAWWLAQIVASTPPASWCEMWKVDPGALIAAAKAGDWSTALTEGWAAASIRFRDAAWVEATLATGYLSKVALPIGPSATDLIVVLPPDRREAVLTAMLRNNAAQNDLPFMMLACEHAWSEKFARTVLEWLRDLFKKAIKTGDWRTTHLLPAFALRIPVSIAGATDEWPANEDGTIPEAVDRFISILSFRKELAQELDR